MSLIKFSWVHILNPFPKIQLPRRPNLQNQAPQKPGFQNTIPVDALMFCKYAAIKFVLSDLQNIRIST